jgi:hypothetical protein
LKKLAQILNGYEEGEYELTDLDPTTFGIQKEDKLFVKVDRTNKKSPRFMMWIMNEQYLWGDLDMTTAASILKTGGEGTSFAEKGVIGAIGSFFTSGGGEDTGTDEETIAMLAAAFAQIAAEKGTDPQMYYDKLDEIFTTKYGSSIKEFLEEEFSGYPEVVSCNVFRRKIEPSVLRGLNFWSILGDVALTLVTFGGSSAFQVAAKGATVANAASKAVKATRVGSAVARGGETLAAGTKAIANFTGLGKVFSKLENARKISALKSAGIEVGKTISYTSRAGKGTSRIWRVEEITNDGVLLARQTKGGGFVKNTAPTSWDNLMKSDEIIDATTKATIAKAAGLSMTTGGVLAGKKIADVSSSGGGTEDANWAEKGAEAMGWYDTIASDPNAYINNAKQQGASDIASMLLDLKNGSGLFGNTTNQEECSIALLITSLTPEMAKEVATEYKKIDAKMSVYDVLDDEIDGDIGLFAKAYWTACTGEGDEYKAQISSMVSRIKTKK